MARIENCENLIIIHVESAFARFKERKKCEAKNLVFEDYEVEKVGECKEHDPHPLP